MKINKATQLDRRYSAQLPTFLIMRLGFLLFNASTTFKNQIFAIYSRYYAKTCNEWRGPPPQLGPGQHSSEETSQRWRTVISDNYRVVAKKAENLKVTVDVI